MKLSELNQLQKEHLAWRLDHKTACGMLTACRIARGELGNLELVNVFVRYGGKSKRSAMIHARKVAQFSLPHLTKRAADFACTHRENHEMYFGNGDSFCRHCGQPLSR